VDLSQQANHLPNACKPCAKRIFIFAEAEKHRCCEQIGCFCYKQRFDFPL